MMGLLKLQRTAALVAATLVVGSSQAFGSLIFFGEDFAGGALPTPNANSAQALFLANLEPGIGVETLESFSDGDPLPLAINLGSVNATLTGTGNIQSADSGAFAISPVNLLVTFSDFTLTFDAPQVAFGFFGTDVGDFGGNLSLSLDGAPGIAVGHRVGAGGSTDGDAFFWGIIDVDNPFTSIGFANSDASDQFGFDDFTVGNAAQVRIPVPATVALFGIGLIGLGWSRRKKT